VKAALILSLGVLSLTAQAKVKLPAIISDHMVVQASAAVPIWGWADPGEAVSVSLGEHTMKATADASGSWAVVFAGLESGEPRTLTVAGTNTLQVSDVLVGEVWLGSGQSNMAMTMNRANDFEKEKAAADLPQIRMFTVNRNPQPEPQVDCGGRWVVCSQGTIAGFSAAAFFFGRELHTTLKVPVGLINSSYGGTPIEAWTSQRASEKLEEYPTIMASWREAEAVPFDAASAQTRNEEALAKYKEQAAADKAAGKPAKRAPEKIVDPRLHWRHPANLFNGMIAPVVGYGIRGVVWYQGESNASGKFPAAYGHQLVALVQDWRRRWGTELPFAWVQLPDFHAPQKEPSENTGWNAVRDGMQKTLSLPRTGMAITLGCGEAGDVHPKNKQAVGHRLALWALSQVYAKEGPASGPIVADHAINGSEVAVVFQHTDGGLKAKDGELKGFAIAGADRKFVWAKARIDGDQVIVSSPEVTAPVAVRYAWADNPVWTLQNGAGLPAAPFRTDDWPLE